DAARGPPGGRRCSTGSAGPPSSPRDGRGARLTGAADDVADLEPERGVEILDLDLGHLDQVAEPLLEACLHAEAQRGRERVAVRGEHQLERARAEGGAIHAFTRRGEEQLLDEVADVRLDVRFRSSPASVESEGEIDLHRVPQVAMTRGWVITAVSGVPVGAQ